MTSLKCDSGNDTPVTIYLPDGQTWDEIYDIELVAVITEKSSGKTFNIGIHIPVAAIWEANSKVSAPDNCFEIPIPQPYPKIQYTLVASIDDKEIKLNLHPIDSEEKGEGRLNHKFSNVLSMKFMMG